VEGLREPNILYEKKNSILKNQERKYEHCRVCVVFLNIPEALWLVSLFMVFNATFNSISVISWRLVLLVKETKVPGENYRPATKSH
jgi:hypothetical protein